ncbi:MAG: hypothetical protein EOO71_04550 [Myxococcaceae bacterium]|nr:MAG: hypothetical protein EOO71_04550 [Myxococcaceae bacterium]
MSLSKHIAKTRKREIKIEPSEVYRKNCSRGFKREGYSQVHHIVCMTSMGKRRGDYPKTPPTLADYLEACLWITKWDIHASGNLIGLPRNRQYQDSDGKIPVNLPSHDRDHTSKDGYVSEVSQYFQENVWCSLTAKKEVHDVDAAKLKQELEAASDEFHSRLLRRGARQGGTQACWGQRFDAARKRTWYHPFSMAKNPSHRSAGISPDDVKNLLLKIRLP